MIDWSGHPDMKKSIKTLCMLITGAVILTACLSFGGRIHEPTGLPPASSTFPEKETLPTQSPNLATPISLEPAAGICGSFEGKWVVITIYPDIPDPRCAIIAPDQMLKVVNSRQETLRVSIGTMEAMIEPGDEHTFDIPFGQYLAPGVHRIGVDPCCGAELWLQADQGGE
jgi:hypothetical protein